MIQKHCQPPGNYLSENGCKRCPRNSHLRQSEQTEDQDRIQNQVRHCADPLRDHRIEGLTGRLQQSLKSHLRENTEARHTADGQVGRTILCYLRNVGLTHKERPAYQ